jgi:hypothetical protein
MSCHVPSLAAIQIVRITFGVNVPSGLGARVALRWTGFTIRGGEGSLV